MKYGSELIVAQLRLDLEVGPSKRLAREDLFITVIKWRRKSELKSVDKSTKAELKNTEQAYDVILSFTKYRLYIGNENK